MSRRRGWRLVLFARCEDASLADSDEWDGPIERDRWWAARLHRLACKPCRREHRLMRWLRRRLGSPPTEVCRCQHDAADDGLKPEAADRINTHLAAERLRDEG